MRETLRRSFRTKLLVSFLVLGILPLLLCTLLMLNTFRVSLTKNAAEAAAANLTKLQGKLDDCLSDCGWALDRLSEYETVRSAVESAAGNQEELVYRPIYDTAGTLLSNADFSVLDAAGKRLYTTAGNKAEKPLPTDWGGLRAAGEADGSVYYEVCSFDGAASNICLRAARAVRNGDDILGYVVAEMTADALSDLLTEPSGELLLLGRFWDVVWATPSIKAEETAAELRSRLLAGQSLGAETGEYSFYAARSEDTGLTLVLRQPKPVAGWVMQQLYLIAGAFILLCLILCVAVAMRLSRQFFEPVRALNDAMGRVEGGNLDVRVDSSGIDEMGQLAGRFDRMVDTLKTNLTESVERQRELKDTQIRMMQAQLNPHFLYNTLDTMKWMGKINQVPEVATISADLADILRTSISGEEFVSLAEELALLERYVEIQTIRFPGKFRFCTEIAPEALPVQVPKLMLQPLVENAIIHGFEDGSSGTVTVSAHLSGTELVVTVRDDGQGMPEESLRRFEERNPKQSGHLGLRNVDTILRLHYGQSCGLQFLPVKGRGTGIRIRLPIIREGGDSC